MFDFEQCYQDAARPADFDIDPAQEKAIQLLASVHRELTVTPFHPGLLGRLLQSKSTPIAGVYLWGGVGRGKTFLMDLFYDSLPFNEKKRYHFHRFMILVHEAMHCLKNRANPLEKIAKDFAKDCRVLCLDEMHITDEGDAVIMEGLLVALIGQGVTLITTSNRAPHDLCADPYLEKLFSKAVHVLESQLTVLQVDGGTDYRLRRLEQAEIWHAPLNGDSQTLLEKAFHEASAIEHKKEDYIVINERKIPVVRWADGVCWFDFDIICGPPRARIDYIEIARFFHSVLIQNIPPLNDENNDYARRFTQMVDEFYDHNVKLVVTAASPVNQVYQGTRLAFEFQRTTSRLIEMQSHDYLAREHNS